MEELLGIRLPHTTYSQDWLPDFRRAALFHERQDFAGMILDSCVARVLDDLATTNEVVQNSSQYRPPSRSSPEGALEKILRRQTSVHSNWSCFAFHKRNEGCFTIIKVVGSCMLPSA